MKKEDELLKCCGRYPYYTTRSDGARKVTCAICGKTTPYYMSAGKSANIEWNKMMEKSENN